jgi:hypothetical protein
MKVMFGPWIDNMKIGTITAVETRVGIHWILSNKLIALEEDLHRRSVERNINGGGKSKMMIKGCT